MLLGFGINRQVRLVDASSTGCSNIMIEAAVRPGIDPTYANNQTLCAVAQSATLLCVVTHPMEHLMCWPGPSTMTENERSCRCPAQDASLRHGWTRQSGNRPKLGSFKPRLASLAGRLTPRTRGLPTSNISRFYIIRSNLHSFRVSKYASRSWRPDEQLLVRDAWYEHDATR